MVQDTATHPVYGRIDGPIVMIGFGSIGKGTWPLIERHFEYDSDKFVVIEPDESNHNFLRQHRLNFVTDRLTPDTYKEVLGGLFERGKGFCVNLSVDTSSLDIMKFCREMGVPYIEHPWWSLGRATTSAPRTTSPAPTTPCARRSGTRRRRTPAAPRRFPAAAPTPAWSAGSSRRRC